MPHGPTSTWRGRESCLAGMMRVLRPDGATIFYNHKWRVQNGLHCRTATKDIVRQRGFPVGMEGHA